MFRACSVAAVLMFLTAICAAQSTATCNLSDDRQVYIRYTPVSTKSDRAANGKPWSPGGAPMTLFTEAELNFGGATIPLGAYTVYPVPGKDKWNLVVNRNVAPGAAYDEKQDLARSAMETVPVSASTDTLEVAFAHSGPKCTLRIYFAKTAAFARRYSRPSSGLESTKSAVARLQAIGTSYTTAIRSSALTSTSCGCGASGSQKKTTRSMRPSATAAPTC